MERQAAAAAAAAVAVAVVTAAYFRQLHGFSRPSQEFSLLSTGFYGPTGTGAGAGTGTGTGTGAGTGTVTGTCAGTARYFFTKRI